MNIKEIAKQNNLSQTDLTILNEISIRMFKGYYKIPIREIASASFVSTTSVIRLAKKLGYEGYSELLYALKIDSTTNVDYKASDAIRSIIIEERSLDVIDNFIRDLASGEYERIHVIGIGYSDYIAQYLRDKLLELDYFSTNKSPLDFLNSRKSLILFVSESGETTSRLWSTIPLSNAFANGASKSRTARPLPTMPRSIQAVATLPTMPLPKNASVV